MRVKIDRDVGTSLSQRSGVGAANSATRFRDNRYFVRQLYGPDERICKENLSFEILRRRQ
jgi:hypothetical protein